MAKPNKTDDLIKRDERIAELQAEVESLNVRLAQANKEHDTVVHALTEEIDEMKQRLVVDERQQVIARRYGTSS